MNYAVFFEPVHEPDFPSGYYYAHIPALGLTTHGLGIDGARATAKELADVWLAEKRACGEMVPASGEFLISVIEVDEHAFQSA